MNFLLYGVLSLVLSSAAWAAGGDWIGNGGDLLRCAQSGTAKVEFELLDYYEGRYYRGLQPDLGPQGTSFDDKVKYVLKRLERRNPSRGALYRSWYQTFFNETRFFLEGRIVEIPDTGPVVIPEGCSIQQIAAQLPDEQILPGDHRYTIDLNLWNQISEETRAGLVLHELVYREAITNLQMNSKRVRYFNEYISSSAFASFGDREMLSLVHTVGFRFVDYYGVPLDISRASYYQGGALLSALATGGKWQAEGHELTPLQNRWVTFDEAGKILRVQDMPSL